MERLQDLFVSSVRRSDCTRRTKLSRFRRGKIDLVSDGDLCSFFFFFFFHKKEWEEKFVKKMSLPPPAVDEKFALLFKPDKPIPIKGDVKVREREEKKEERQVEIPVLFTSFQVSVWHTGPKPLVHFWLNTRFHTQFPLVLEKRQIDGSDKDPKCKKFPHDFRIVVDLRFAEPHESVLPLANDKYDKKKPSVSVSGFTLEPSVRGWKEKKKRGKMSDFFFFFFFFLSFL